MKHEESTMGRKMKDMALLRALFRPYMEAKKKREHARYLNSPDSYYLKTLRGIHSGKRCFIIGNGPSLRADDLDKLVGEYTFAANKIYKIFEQTQWRPTYYVSVDRSFLHQQYANIRIDDLGHLFIAADKKACIEGSTRKVTKINCEAPNFEVRINRWNDMTAYVSEDASSYLCDKGTVTFVSIQLAIYMGFSEIYLLGVDHCYSKYRDASGKLHVDNTLQDNFENVQYPDAGPFYPNTSQYVYEISREYCDNHGIKIYNATRGGRLEVFERVDFDKIIGGGLNDKLIVIHLKLPSACFMESEAA